MALLGERVAMLQQRLNSQVETMDIDDAAADAPQASTAPVQGIKADSLSVLLQQALQSEDRALLERVISVGDERVIYKTIQRLPTKHVAPFLNAAVQRLQAKPVRARQLAVWINAVLQQHTAYLVNAPSAQAALTALYQSIQGRLALYQPLLSLSGRLDLLAGQLASRDGQGAAQGILQNGPQVSYEESDEDEQPQAENVATLGALVSSSDDDEDEDGDWETDDEDEADDT